MMVRHICPTCEVSWVGNNRCWVCRRRCGIPTYRDPFHRTERSVIDGDLARLAQHVGAAS